MKSQRKFRRNAIAAGVVALAISGCAGSSLPWHMLQSTGVVSAANASNPRVQDCINIDSSGGSGTPSKYVCNGKVYTSRELNQTRHEGGSTAMASNK